MIARRGMFANVTEVSPIVTSVSGGDARNALSFDVSSKARLGDYLVIAVSIDAGSMPASVAGYSVVVRDTSNLPSYGLIAREITDTSQANVSFAADAVSSSANSAWVAILMRGLSGSYRRATPNNETGSDYSWPSLTGVTAGSIVLYLGFLDDDIVSSQAAIPDFENLGAASGGVSGNGASIAAWGHPNVAGGTFGGFVTSNGGSDNNSAEVLEFLTA